MREAAQANRVPCFLIRPMLAVPGSPFDSPDFIYEVKWDGYRCLAYLNGQTLLQSRNLLDITPAFPELAGLHCLAGAKPLVLDGEIIVPGDDGRPSFQRLQARGRKAGQLSGVSAREAPALYVAFDLLYRDGDSVMGKPLLQRKSMLREAIKPGDSLILSEFAETSGIDFYRACLDRGLEGAMAKEKNSPYLPGRRSAYWQKFRHTKEEDFVILGYEPGKGSRLLGSLLLGEWREGSLVYRGKVGTGFSRKEEEALLGELGKLAASRAPLPGFLPPEIKKPCWVRPELVCAVEYLEITTEGRLRHPTYRGLKWDRGPEDIRDGI